MGIWQAITGFIALILQTIYGFIGNYGVSIIVFTILMRLLLFPLSVSQRKNMEQNKLLQPKIKELQKKYKSDPQTLQQKQMELFKEHNFNPLSGCLPLLVQMPIIFALFSVLRNAGEFMPPEAINQSFMWLPNMIDADRLSNIIPQMQLANSLPGLWPILAAIFTWLSMKQTQNNQQLSQDPDGPKMPNMSMMTTLFPAMILFFGLNYSAGLIVYWAVSNIIQFIQEKALTRMFTKKEVM